MAFDVALLISGAVGAAVGAGIGLVKELRVVEATLGIQHRQDERRNLRKLQSHYKGRVLEAALDWTAPRSSSGSSS